MSNRVKVLRAVADLMEAHPRLQMPHLDPAYHAPGIELIRFQLTSEDNPVPTAVAIMKAIPGPYKENLSAGNYTLYGKFAGVPVEIRMTRAGAHQTPMPKSIPAFRLHPDLAAAL